MAHTPEWLPISTAPSHEALEVCVMDYNGIVQVLKYPCNKDGPEWVDASYREHIYIQPTHWRKWTESQRLGLGGDRVKASG